MRIVTQKILYFILERTELTDNMLLKGGDNEYKNWQIPSRWRNLLLFKYFNSLIPENKLKIKPNKIAIST